MACKNQPKVYLGYGDEFVTEKNRSLVNFATNKIGGKPDLPNSDTCLPSPPCKLCGLNQLLALQIYAPLDNSKYHRTLYIFACINPNCWNRNESWTCLRVQSLQGTSMNDSDVSALTIPPSTTSWLAGSDDWGDDGNDNTSEKNGNNMLRDESNEKFNLFMKTTDIEESMHEGLLNLRVDDPNANSPTSVESPVGGGAVGRLDSPQACAEIEGEESEVVCIDTPTQPQCNLIDLLHEVTPHPFHHSDMKSHGNITFVETFIGVDEEDLSADVPQHVRDLYLEYQLCNPDLQKDALSVSNEMNGIEITNAEKYEKCVPKHGDEMFHNFSCRIQRNPGQLLRYCRDNRAPLILTALGNNVGLCRNCGSERVFEIQILPTIIPKLKIVPCVEKNFEIEFGTILIFTCTRSCWSPSDIYKEEHVIVQAEQMY